MRNLIPILILFTLAASACSQPVVTPQIVHLLIRLAEGHPLR